MNLINRIQINVSKILRIIGEKQGNLHLIKRKPIQNIIIPVNIRKWFSVFSENTGLLLRTILQLSSAAPSNPVAA